MTRASTDPSSLASTMSEEETEIFMRRLTPAFLATARADDLKMLRWLIRPEARETREAMAQLARDAWQETQKPYEAPPRNDRKLHAFLRRMPRAPVSYRALSFAELCDDFSWVSELFRAPWKTHEKIRDLVPKSNEQERKFTLLGQGSSELYEKLGFDSTFYGVVRPATLAEAIGYIREYPEELKEQNIVFVGSYLPASQGGCYFGAMRLRGGARHLSVVHSTKRIKSSRPSAVLCVAA